MYNDDRFYDGTGCRGNVDGDRTTHRAIAGVSSGQEAVTGWKAPSLGTAEVRDSIYDVVSLYYCTRKGEGYCVHGSVSVAVKPVRPFADGKPVAAVVVVLVAVIRVLTVVVVVVVVGGLRRVLLRLVVYFGRGAEALLPVPRPIVVLHGHLLGRFRVPAHRHAIDQAAHQRQEAEYQEHDAQHPAGTKNDRSSVEGGKKGARVAKPAAPTLRTSVRRFHFLY